MAWFHLNLPLYQKLDDLRNKFYLQKFCYKIVLIINWMHMISYAKISVLYAPWIDLTRHNLDFKALSSRIDRDTSAEITTLLSRLLLSVKLVYHLAFRVGVGVVRATICKCGPLRTIAENNPYGLTLSWSNCLSDDLSREISAASPGCWIFNSTSSLISINPLDFRAVRSLESSVKTGDRIYSDCRTVRALATYFSTGSNVNDESILRRTYDRSIFFASQTSNYCRYHPIFFFILLLWFPNAS